MLVYNGTKNDFMNSVENDTIAYEIQQKLIESMNRHTARNEFMSWENSLQYMYKVLNDKEIPIDSGIAIEYNSETQKENVIIIELKQWDQLDAVDGKEAVVETYTGNAKRKVVHPSYQAWSYAQLINDYNYTVQQDEIDLHPCTYLHNYWRKDNDPLDDIQYQIYLEDAPAFTRGQVEKLREFIKKNIVKGDNESILYKIDNGKIKPSKSLQNEIASMIKGNQEFVLIDDQKVIYEEILDEVYLT